MCNINCLNKIPRSIWILAAILGVIAVTAITYGIIKSLNTHYEEGDDAKEESTEKSKEKVDDFELEIRLRKHKANLEHEREIEKEKNRHKSLTIGIALPICLIIVAMICGTILVIYCKNWNTTKETSQRKVNMEMVETKIAIPKARLDDFNTLANIGFDKKGIAKEYQQRILTRTSD